MSILTVPLSSEETENIDKLKIVLKEKTATGCIRKMIKNHQELINDNDEMRTEIRRLKDRNRRLKDSGQDYFNSMHQLMRDCEFESKL